MGHGAFDAYNISDGMLLVNCLNLNSLSGRMISKSDWAIYRSSYFAIVSDLFHFNFAFPYLPWFHKHSTKVDLSMKIYIQYLLQIVLQGNRDFSCEGVCICVLCLSNSTTQ